MTTKIDPNMITATPTTSAGVGQWQRIFNSVGSALNAPADGTWAYFHISIKDADKTVGDIGAGVVAGGAQINSAVPGYQHYAFVWRVG